MLATKNPVRKIMVILAGTALISVSGCKPAGPQALILGDELLREGQAAKAVEKLKRATDLMPDEPRAWNLLGLAYHQSGQPQLALQAYRQALAKDRSNIVAVTHYNLGSLLLEQGNPAAALDELRSYTLITNSAVGWVKLGTAQLRLRQLDSAERSFAAALRLEAKNIEALNGVGVLHVQRNQRDAIQYFNAALQENPKFAPAILNSGLLAQQNAATKPAALQRFRDYLALRPDSPNAEGVKLLVRQLEGEMTPVRPANPTGVPAQAATPPKTNTTPPQFTILLQPTAAPPRTVVLASNVKPQSIAAKTNEALPAKAIRTSPTATSAPPTNLPVTVVAVAPDALPRIAEAAPLVSTPPSREPAVTVAPLPTTPSENAPPSVTAPVEESRKPGFLSRLNPFRSRNKQSTNEVPQTVVQPAPMSIPPSEAVVAAAPKPTFPRYSYRSPGLPVRGNRVNAERAMQQAVKAHRAGNTNEALVAYQLSLNADPSYFDAQYNSALLALQSGDLNRALAGWETALALEPDSLNARYNFALALKQGNYAHDAARELEKILEAKPTDSRAHLTLANLYAQQMKEKAKARTHYLKVLELEPRSPQASAIRFWLAANS